MVHAGIAVVLVVAVVAVAYGTQPPGLAVAEFSPAARQTLDSPPTTGAGEQGRGGATGQRSTTTTAPLAATTVPAGPEGRGAPTTKLARARRCFGDPPLQTEDPMSPACMATIFEGDNGGATSHGVSATEIRIAVPVTAGFSAATSGTNARRRETLLALFEYVNQRFELYGRRLVPAFVEGSATDAVTSRSLGMAAGKAGAFGAITGPIELTGQFAQASLLQELARNGVVTVARNEATWWSDRSVFDDLHPYVWSVAPSSEQMQRDLGGVGCALADEAAAFTRDADVVGKSRRFGIVAAGQQLPPNASVLASTLQACTGVAPARLDWTSLGDPSWAALRTGITRFAAEGVTTLFCVCESYLQDWAAYVGYELGFAPEIFFTPTGYSEGDERIAQFGVGRGLVMMQIQTGPRLVPLQARPWFRALQATNPGLTAGDQATRQAVFGMGEFAYSQLLVLASGIQAAGPSLTAETFAAGLMSAQFPNPEAGQGPTWLPAVGFGPGDHSFYDDFAIGWLSDTAPAIEPYSPYPFGSWCYVGTGARFRGDTVPADLHARLFDTEQPCR